MVLPRNRTGDFDKAYCLFVGRQAGVDPQGRCRESCRYNPLDASVIPQLVERRVAHCEAVISEPEVVELANEGE